MFASNENKFDESRIRFYARLYKYKTYYQCITNNDSKKYKVKAILNNIVYI